MYDSGSLIIVNNPSQLLFALEAAAYYGADMSQCHVRAIPTPGSQPSGMYKRLLTAANVSSFSELPVSSLALSARMRDVWRWSASYAGEIVITPMVNYLPARRLLRLAAARGIVTDDGAWTVEFARLRRSGETAARDRIRDLTTMSGLPSQITLFTLYPELQAGLRDKVDHNRLAWTRSTFRGRLESASNIILGSNLVGAGYLTMETYLVSLRRALNMLGSDVEYWPHRRESASELRQIRNDLGVSIRVRELPLEAEIVSLGEAPKNIVTLPSTSLRTLSLLRTMGEYKLVLLVPPEKDVAVGKRSLMRAALHGSSDDADVIL